MKFLRRLTRQYSKLGRKRKSKQVWRKPKGRDNKLREKRKNRGPVVSIGYRTEKTGRGKINGKSVVTVMNAKELNKVGKNEIIIVGKVGKKKKSEIVKKANEMKIEIQNINTRKFLKKLENKK